MDMKTGRRRLSEAARARIIEMARAGKSLEEIASSVKVSVPTICKVKKEAGLARRAQNLSYEQIREKYLAAVKEVEYWKRKLAEAIQLQEKKIAADRHELGL